MFYGLGLMPKALASYLTMYTSYFKSLYAKMAAIQTPKTDKTKKLKNKQRKA